MKNKSFALSARLRATGTVKETTSSAAKGSGDVPHQARAGEISTEYLASARRNTAANVSGGELPASPL
jgi:hypothetical protein